MPLSPPRRVLITGATAGIGRAAALVFAREGYAVAVLGHLADEVEETVEAIRAEGDAAVPVVADLSQAGAAAGVIESLEADGFPLDVLVNNAGVGLQADVVDTRDEDLRRLFEVNYFSAFILSRDALKAMGARRSGHIVQVSSASARRSLPGMSVYASTKAAMHALSQSLRIEARSVGVQVTEILPMSVRTGFFQSAVNRAGKPYRAGGRMATPETVAERILNAVRKPAPEVYTSTLSRIVLALDAANPKILDAVLHARRAREKG